MTKNNVKNINPAVNDESPFASKLQNIELGLSDKTIVFKDIMGYQVGSQWVQVAEKDGTSFVYPANQVVFIKSYFSDKE